ncbi:MAG: hypothetical protein AB8B57_08330 [Congregibacter sp.]
MPNIDPAILELIPHREPMLLIHELIDVNASHSVAVVHIDESLPFYRSSLGIPAAIGMEYMGQAAALIAGFQEQQGQLTEHLGFLLGARDYKVSAPYFKSGTSLRVHCQETAVVGEGLARFDCSITQIDTDQILATGKLSVFRQALQSKEPREHSRHG